METSNMQECRICKQTIPLEQFNKILKRWRRKDPPPQDFFKELIPSKNCIECGKIQTEKSRIYAKNKMTAKYKHIWTREDGSTITDPYEIVDDKKLHICSLCKLSCPVREFNITGKYNPKLTKTCTYCSEASKQGLVLPPWAHARCYHGDCPLFSFPVV